MGLLTKTLAPWVGVLDVWVPGGAGVWAWRCDGSERRRAGPRGAGRAGGQRVRVRWARPLPPARRRELGRRRRPPPPGRAAKPPARRRRTHLCPVYTCCHTLRRRMRACPRPLLHAARRAPLGLRASSDSSAAQPATSQPPRRASEEEYNRAMQAYSHAPYEYKHEAGLCVLPCTLPHRLGLTPCAQTFTR